MNTNSTLAQKVLLHLARLGVREVCVAAGARNTPLLTALLASSGVKLWNFFEERSAAFFALGRMMVDRRPVAVVTTSGTAAAELLPGVIEAHYQALPLLMITADRPPRYRGSGAPQAIEQVGLFGGYAERTLDLTGSANDPIWPEALGRKPLHVNVCFDEPLVGESRGIDFAAWGEPEAKAKANDSAMAEVLDQLIAARSDLVVLASGLREEEATMLTPALKKLGVPIVAEATANLHDATLKPLLVNGGEKALVALKPKRVLRLGSVPSWRWWRDLEDQPQVHVMHLSNAPFSGLARHQGVAAQSLSLLRDATIKPSGKDARLAGMGESVVLEKALETHPLSEPAWMRHLSEVIPAEARVFLGNSLPIREWNFAAKHRHECFANRGANGIDGIVSSFYGVGLGAKESWLVVGDLSALYDLSAPWIAAQLPGANRRIVIINNGGGKIFARVESLRALDAGARGMIENQHTMDFKPWADLWKMDYRLVTAVGDLAGLPDGDVVVEVRPDAVQTEAFWAGWR